MNPLLLLVILVIILYFTSLIQIKVIHIRNTCLSNRLWYCIFRLRQLATLNLGHISIQETYDEPLQRLPTVRKVKAWRVERNALQKLSELLPAVVEMDIHFGREEGSLNEYLKSVIVAIERMGRTLKTIKIDTLLYHERGCYTEEWVSSTTCQLLGRILKLNAECLKTVIIKNLLVRERFMSYIIESCQQAKCIEFIRFVTCTLLLLLWYHKYQDSET